MILFFSSATGAYCVSDEAFWHDSTVYTVLEHGEVSNSTLDFAFLKVKYDYDAHRVHLLFMLTFDDFEDETKSGVKMELNGTDTVELYCDGTGKYDTELFFAEMEQASSPVTCSQCLEVTLGIKEGIPEKLIMRVSFTDTFGDTSNTFELDITPAADEPTQAEENSTKTTKKIKTAKVKTTKTKKTVKPKTKSDDDKAKNELTGTTANYTGAPKKLEVYTEKNGKKTVLIIGVSAAVLMVAAGCTAAIVNKEKDKGKRG